MKVVIIVAVAKDLGIGKNNQLLWRLPEDMAFFRRSTMGHVVITGRKNYESIPEKFRPLKGRTNVVVTRQENYKAPGAEVFTDIKEALDFALSKGDERVYVIGGGQIYKEYLDKDLVDEMLITHVDGEFDADVYFPKFNENQWSMETLAHYEPDERHSHGFNIIRYQKK